jgi:hypothetical protein
MTQGFWLSKDFNGVVHETLSVSFPVLLYDNNVNYIDGDTSLCGRHEAGGWVACPEGTVITCVPCWAERFRLDEMASGLTERAGWNESRSF